MQWIDEAMLDRFRFGRVCEWCKKPSYGLDPHHVYGRGMGGGSRLDLAINLIGLCWNDHRSELPAGRILRCDLLAVVAKREGVLQDPIRAVVRDLRRERPAAMDKAATLVAVYARHGLPSPLATQGKELTW